MSPYSVVWLVIFVAIGVTEYVALVHGTFADTLTGTAVRLMLANRWVMWLVPTLLLGLAWHLMYEALRTR